MDDRGRAGEPPEVSVVLPCYNAEEFLADQLRALAGQVSTRPWELVISDNGSTDRSLEVVERHRHLFAHLVVVDSSDTRGPGAARNAGVAAASGELIRFRDADDEVAPGWLEAMADALEHESLVAASVDDEHLNEPHPFRARPSERGLLQSLPPFLPYTLGGAIGVRRSAHDRVGGFDVRYRDSCEDRDYCYRLQFDGVPLVFVPTAVIYYRHRTSLAGIFRQSRGYARGSVLIYREYRSQGLPRPSATRSLVHWLAMPFRLSFALTSAERLTSWMVRAGRQVGRLEGCLRYRVWAP